MRINKIKLTNVFSYKNTVEFNFENEQNINLIIGENGFGKTSFINAIKIALHGITKEQLLVGETRLTVYEFIQGSDVKHFSGIINRIAKEEGAKECFIQLQISHKGKDFMIKRSFRVTSTSYDEELSIAELATSKQMLNEEAQDFINGIISPSLAKFFFFDGEKVQNIANFSNEEFRIMLENVLELDVYDQIIFDYTQRKGEYLQEGIKDEKIKEKFASASREIEIKKEAVESYKQEIKNIKNSTKDVKKEITFIGNKIKKINSEYSYELDKENTKLSSLLIEKEKKLTLFKKISMSCLPLLLNKELGLKTEFDILNNYYDSNYIPIEVLRRKKAEFMDIVNEKLKNGEDIEEIFDSVFFSERKGIRVNFADTSKVEFQYKSLDLNLVAFVALLEDLILVDEQILLTKDTLNSIKSAIKENEISLALLIEEQSSKTLLVQQQEAKCLYCEEEIRNHNDAILFLEKELRSISIQEHRDALTLASIGICEKIIKTSKRIKEEIKTRKKDLLEQKINEKFSLLIKEDYSASYLKISENFSINIYDINHTPMDILSSSSGQKQIIATSLIWAISEYVDSSMPMIVDTPLGRLDDKNQKLLLEKFYPKASSQIIMLPTLSELRADGFAKIIEDAMICFWPELEDKISIGV